MSQNCDRMCCEPKESITLPVTGFRLPGLGIGIDVDAEALRGQGLGKEDIQRMIDEAVSALPKPLPRPESHLVIHVSKTGDDANSGLTEAEAKRTINNALQEAHKYNLQGLDFTVSIAAGEYEEYVNIDWEFGANARRIILEGKQGDTVTIKAPSGGNNWTIIYQSNITGLLRNLSIIGNPHGVQAAFSVSLFIEDCTFFGISTSMLMVVNTCSSIRLLGTISVKGEMDSGLLAQTNGTLTINNGNFNIMPGTKCTYLFGCSHGGGDQHECSPGIFHGEHRHRQEV